jgi:hypothetical protein
MIGKHFTPELHPQLLILSEAYFFHHSQKTPLTVDCQDTVPMKQNFCLHPHFCLFMPLVKQGQGGPAATGAVRRPRSTKSFP